MITDNLPAEYIGHPWLYLLTVFSLLLTLLLALEWTWRTVWSYFDVPRPIKHPYTVLRTVVLLLLVQLLVRLGPDVWLIMRWPRMTPAERLTTELIDSRLDTTSFIWMGAAWFIWRVAQPFVSYQLEKEPLPIHLWPTIGHIKRPLYIAVGVFLIAFALTFLR